ncbi:ABC transporter substrate-binding protein [Mesorhizobium sp. VNQ89]|uniref:ABC transporter substrate-binding protein n=1 Tax=Mesorhizobium quangtriensis TaxID=3157709 RepID=UPI0032B85332
MTRAALVILLLGTVAAAAEEKTIVIESWRDDDLSVWQDRIIPAFEARTPGIKVVFSPTGGETYDAELAARLGAGKAGDLMACRPFDASLDLYNKGYLAPLNDLPGLDAFSAFARSAWSTNDGKTTFCVPIASVIHGFLYNADAFEQLGIAAPTTEAEFFAALDKIRADGTYTPLAMGTKDGWEAGILGYQNIGPAYWRGEDGRTALVAGKQKLTDAQWMEPLATLARWKDYLGTDFEKRSYADSQKLFASGRAAIYPAGSWEISGFNAQARFRLGAFPPPVRNAGDGCYISDHPDIGIGLNPKSAHAEAARTFLAWVASPEFASIYADALPGFVGLIQTPKAIDDPLAATFASWRSRCKSTFRSTDAVLSRGTPSLADETRLKATAVVNGTETPQDAAAELQKSLDDQPKAAR